MSQRLRLNLLFAVLCWTWGSTWVAIRLGLEGVPPVLGACVRILGSSFLLLAIAAALRLRLPRSRSYLAQIAIQGTGQFGLNFALVYWAEQTVPSGLAAVVFSVTPLMTAAAAAFVAGERLNAANVAGLFVGLAGVVVVYWAEVVQIGGVPPLGIAAVLAAAALVSVASVIAKRWGGGIAPLAIAGPGQLFGGALLGVIAAATEWRQPVTASAAALGATLYLMIAGALAFLAYFYLLRSVAVTRLALITYITPVTAVVLGGFLLHERLAPSTFAGALLIFAGVALMYRRTQVVTPEAVEPVPATILTK